MASIKSILQGHKNNLLRNNPQVEQQAQKRLNTCERCIYFTTAYGFKQCSLCGCPLQAKTRATQEQCPINKW